MTNNLNFDFLMKEITLISIKVLEKKLGPLSSSECTTLYRPQS